MVSELVVIALLWFYNNLRLHSCLGILASTRAFVFAARRIQAIIHRNLKLVRREAVVLLNLVVAHVAVFVHATVLQDVEYRCSDGERFVFQEALLHDNAKVHVVVIVVEIQLVAVRAEHEVDIDLPIVLETESVEGVEGKDRLVEINPAYAFGSVNVFEVKPEVLFLICNQPL